MSIIGGSAFRDSDFGVSTTSALWDRGLGIGEAVGMGETGEGGELEVGLAAKGADMGGGTESGIEGTMKGSEVEGVEGSGLASSTMRDFAKLELGFCTLIFEHALVRECLAKEVVCIDGLCGKAAICLNRESANEAEGGVVCEVGETLCKELDEPETGTEADRLRNSKGIWGGGLAGAGDLRI